MRLPKIAIVVADEQDVHITLPPGVQDAWTLELDGARFTTTDAALLRANTERVISLLRTYRDVLDHLIEIQSDTDARAIRQREKEGTP